MASPELEARLKKIVAEQLGVDESKIVPARASRMISTPTRLIWSK